ncbi:hypothetical protein SOVF_155220 [Spinacia oleracea]|nr:hypothetical protein SOVF_155220 [Spinacia oleracea]
MASRLQRHKFAWRVLMVSNFGVAAYIFGMNKKKEGSSKSEKHEEAPLVAGTSTSKVSSEPKTEPPTPIAEILPAVISFMEEPGFNPETSTGTSAPMVNCMEESEMIPATPIAELVKVREPIAEDQQRQLFGWMLDEKRKNVYEADQGKNFQYSKGL